MKIILMMAQTADGKIAKNKNHLANWTSKEDKIHFITETKKHQVIIMGESTYLTIGKPLPGRFNLILTPNPQKFTKFERPGLLKFISGSPKEIVTYLQKRGFKSAILGGGAYTNASFLQAGLVNEIILTVEGLLFGQGFGFCEGLEKDIKLRLIGLKKLSNTTYLAKYKLN